MVAQAWALTREPGVQFAFERAELAWSQPEVPACAAEDSPALRVAVWRRGFPVEAPRASAFVLALDAALAVPAAAVEFAQDVFVVHSAARLAWFLLSEPAAAVGLAAARQAGSAVVAVQAASVVVAARFVLAAVAGWVGSALAAERGEPEPALSVAPSVRFALRDDSVALAAPPSGGPVSPQRSACLVGWALTRQRPRAFRD